MSLLALGTAQLGLPYGIANKRGRVSLSEIEDILDFAHSAGIDLLDTAASYGDSEARLGEVGTELFKVITKLPRCPECEGDASRWVHEQVRASLQRLRVDRLYGLLLHVPGQLLSPIGPQLRAALGETQRQGLVEKIGVSVYSTAELGTILPLLPAGIVQAPFSLVDRQFAETGWLQRLRSNGTEIHIRSVFLQGLLLMPQQQIPVHFAKWAPLWETWHKWLQKSGLSAPEACLAFVRSFPEIDRILVGVDSLVHLRELVAASNAGIPKAWPSIECSDSKLINPSLWARP